MTCFISFAIGDLANMAKSRGYGGMIDFIRLIYPPHEVKVAAKRWSRLRRIAASIPVSERDLSLPFQYYVRKVEPNVPHLIKDIYYVGEFEGVLYDMSGDPIKFEDIRDGGKVRYIERKYAEGLAKMIASQMSPTGGHSSSKTVESAQFGDIDTFSNWDETE